MTTRPNVVSIMIVQELRFVVEAHTTTIMKSHCVNFTQKMNWEIKFVSAMGSMKWMHSTILFWTIKVSPRYSFKCFLLNMRLT